LIVTAAEPGGTVAEAGVRAGGPIPEAEADTTGISEDSFSKQRAAGGWRGAPESDAVFSKFPLTSFGAGVRRCGNGVPSQEEGPAKKPPIWMVRFYKDEGV